MFKFLSKLFLGPKPWSVIKTTRRTLALPLLALKWVVIGLSYVFATLSRVIRKINLGMRDHVFWVIVQAQRIVIGSPRWRVTDLIKFGIQPRTEADRAIADADERLMRRVCICDDPKCPNKEPTYVAFPREMAMRVPANMTVGEIMKRSGIRSDQDDQTAFADAAGRVAPESPESAPEPKGFKAELEALINRHSIDSLCATPDYILADFVVESLRNFSTTVTNRDYQATRKPPEAA